MPTGKHASIKLGEINLGTGTGAVTIHTGEPPVEPNMYKGYEYYFDNYVQKWRILFENGSRTCALELDEVFAYIDKQTSSGEEQPEYLDNL
jgi:hypothetical protein